MCPRWGDMLAAGKFIESHKLEMNPSGAGELKS